MEDRKRRIDDELIRLIARISRMGFSGRQRRGTDEEHIAVTEGISVSPSAPIAGRVRCRREADGLRASTRSLRSTRPAEVGAAYAGRRSYGSHAETLTAAVRLAAESPTDENANRKPGQERLLACCRREAR